MAIPSWERFMVPLLQALTDGQAHDRRELHHSLAEAVGLTEAEREERLPSGTQVKYQNRIGWCASFLVKADAIERPSRGRYRITEIGRTLLAAHPEGLVERDLMELVGGNAEWEARWKSGRVAPASTPIPVAAQVESSLDPAEQVEQAITAIEADVAAELLGRLLDQSPEFFEQAVVDVLLAMGYGGAEQRGKRIGGTGDGGVDGVIDQDALGLDQIYVQSKRYAVDRSVGRETIQAFIGALHGFGASRGVFITTSTFTSGARQYADSVPTRVVLIDGERLTGLMVKYRVGVQVRQTYSVVEIDEDFFE